MLKGILGIKGVSELQKKEQLQIKGKGVSCAPIGVCQEYGWYCSEHKCQGLLGGPGGDYD